MARGLKFRIYKEEGLYYLRSENKGADKALFFLILGLRIFFQNIKVGGGKKIKIKSTKNFFFLLNLKHIWIGEKKQPKIV